ncbi:hypothetical protein [Treponema sp.]|uniref:hypothetical protein n=1 Tax=Treponema sp. TaxID=166 RepID=UPI00298DF2AB|nr:hypothetical protein [Treponema sp.]MCR5612204.1 hypothetical protein [Treponema sp.]
MRFVLTLIFISILSSCSMSVLPDVNKMSFFNGFQEDLIEETTTVIHFYSEKEGAGITPSVITRRYRIGKTLSSSDLPHYDDAEVAQWNPGYRLAGWKYYRKTGSETLMDDGAIISSMKIMCEEYDLVAVWHSPYKVVHNFEEVDGTYTQEEETLYGEAGTSAAYTLRTRTGFHVISGTVRTINADGSTVVNVTYDRNTVNLTFDAGDGEFSDGTHVKTLTGKYGHTPVPPLNPTRTDYQFVRWNPEIPSTFPAESMTIEAVWRLSVSPSGTVTLGGGQTISFSLSQPNISSPDTQNVSVEAQITEAGGSSYGAITGAQLATKFEGLSIRLFEGTHQVTSSDVSGFAITDGVITIPSGLPNGLYTVYITGSYDGTAFSASLDLRVSR